MSDEDQANTPKSKLLSTKVTGFPLDNVKVQSKIKKLRLLNNLEAKKCTIKFPSIGKFKGIIDDE